MRLYVRSLRPMGLDGTYDADESINFPIQTLQQPLLRSGRRCADPVSMSCYLSPSRLLERKRSHSECEQFARHSLHLNPAVNLWRFRDNWLRRVRKNRRRAG